MMNKCKCGSYAINHNCHGRDGSDPDLCDVCYWRKRAAPAQSAQAEDIDHIADVINDMVDWPIDRHPNTNTGPDHPAYEVGVRRGLIIAANAIRAMAESSQEGK